MALVDVGDAMRELGEVKDALDMEVKQNFIDPLQNIYDKDLKEIQVRYKKLLHWNPPKPVPLRLQEVMQSSCKTHLLLQISNFFFW